MGLTKTRKHIEGTNFHLLLCYSKKGTSCCSCKKLDETHSEIKKQIKELKEDGIRVSLFTTPCLKVCDQGPLMIVYPEGIWYHSVTPKVVRKIFEYHLRNGEIYQENLLGKVQGKINEQEVCPLEEGLNP